MSKVVVVTGTSTRLGISISVKAVQSGHKVYATMRNLEKREALDRAAAVAGVTLEVLSLDVQSATSVHAAVETVMQNEGRIDLLINNAGAGYVRTTEQASEEDIQWVMDVNFMGVVRCTKAVIPHMRQQGSGHILAVSSVGGLVGQRFNEIYCAAKFAVEGYMEALATYVTEPFGIDFSVVEPGGISTEFAANVLEHVQQTGGLLEDEYLPILQKYIAGSQDRQAGSDIYQTPDEVAEVIMACISADAPPIRMRTSKWAEDFASLKTGLDPDGKEQRARVIEEFLS